jgi:hypothetical protein
MVNADIDFAASTITFKCPRCRRKHRKRIEETKSPLNIKCSCEHIISWVGDLTWVQCIAQPYGITVTRLNGSSHSRFST